MTITNHASDGLYPELIVLFCATAEYGPLKRADLIRICTADHSERIEATLNTWHRLGLFIINDDDTVKLGTGCKRTRGEGLQSFTERLPAFCRHLIFETRNARPLWPANGELSDTGIGESADLVRELAWTLAQDIYTFPVDSTEEQAVSLEGPQRTPGKFIFKNKARWSGVKFWARFTGFLAADSGCIDPTRAIRDELPDIFQGSSSLPAGVFLRALASRLPVLDFGVYRQEVEGALNASVWRRPPEAHLSTALSFALRRLTLDRLLVLDAPADAGEAFALSGRNFRTWQLFSRVAIQGRLS